MVYPDTPIARCIHFFMRVGLNLQSWGKNDKDCVTRSFASAAKDDGKNTKELLQADGLLSTAKTRPSISYRAHEKGVKK